MSKVKRLKRKRALQKKANIRQMALQKHSKVMLGSRKLLKRMPRDHLDVLQNIEFMLPAIAKTAASMTASSRMP
jgi:hypothetical protein